MGRTSNVGDLIARLQQKIEPDRQQIEALTLHLSCGFFLAYIDNLTSGRLTDVSASAGA